MSDTIRAQIDALTPEHKRLLAVRLGLTAQTGDQLKLAAFVTTDDTLTPEAIRAELREQLPRYMVPAQISVLEAMPQTPNGKIDRAALRALAVRPIEQPVIITPTEPETVAGDDIEQTLIDIWEELLGVEILSVDDDFFELGGYSLLAIRMFAQIKQQFDRELPVALIMEAPTIAKLAERLRDQPDKLAAQMTFTLREGDPNQTPLYCLQVNKFGIIHYQTLARQLGDRPVIGVALPQDMADNNPPIVDVADLFARAIRQHRPEGSYALAGLSTAGIIAFEVARRLKADGVEQVTPILFDTYGPDHPKMQPALNAVLQKSGVVLRELVTGDRAERADFLRNLRWQLRYRLGYRLNAPLNRLRVLLGKSPVLDERRAFRVDGELIGQQMDAYFAEDRSFDGDVLLYRARLQPWRSDYAPYLGWDRYTPAEKITVQPVIGPHTALLRAGYVEPIAKHLAEYLVVNGF